MPQISDDKVYLQLKIVADKLNEIIDKRNIKKAYISRQTGLTRSNIDRILSGENYTIESLMKISTCLNTSICDLFGDGSNNLEISSNYSATSIGGDAFVVNEDCPESENAIKSMTLEIELLRQLLKKTETLLEEKERFINHLLQKES